MTNFNFTTNTTEAVEFLAKGTNEPLVVGNGETISCSIKKIRYQHKYIRIEDWCSAGIEYFDLYRLKNSTFDEFREKFISKLDEKTIKSLYRLLQDINDDNSMNMLCRQEHWVKLINEKLKENGYIVEYLFILRGYYEGLAHSNVIGKRKTSILTLTGFLCLKGHTSNKELYDSDTDFLLKRADELCKADNLERAKPCFLKHYCITASRIENWVNGELPPSKATTIQLSSLDKIREYIVNSFKAGMRKNKAA